MSTPEGASKSDILSSTHANELRTRFNNAIENEIPYHPWKDGQSEDPDEREDR